MENGIIIALSTMVWGCFWGKRKGPLVPITQNINKTSYIRLLKRYLFHVIDQVFSFGMQDVLFQQENACNWYRLPV